MNIEMKSLTQVCRKCYGNDVISELTLQITRAAEPFEEQYFDSAGYYHHHINVITGTWSCSNGHHGTFIRVDKCGDECAKQLPNVRFVLSYDK